MEKEIVLKTEVVKVSELEGREKQIYDYAYLKGQEDAEDINMRAKAETISLIVAVIMLIVFTGVVILIEF